MSDRLLSTRQTLCCLAGAAIFWPIAYLTKQSIWCCGATVADALHLTLWASGMAGTCLGILGAIGAWGELADRIKAVRFRLRHGERPEPVPALTAERLRELASAERGRMIVEELRCALDAVDAQQNDAQEHRSRPSSPRLSRRRV